MRSVTSADASEHVRRPSANLRDPNIQHVRLPTRLKI